jgi:hypothetical protein
MKAYLIINDQPFVSYKEKYRVIFDKDLALMIAKKLGYEESFIPFDDTIGMLNFHAWGDVSIGILPIDIEGWFPKRHKDWGKLKVTKKEAYFTEMDGE